MSTGITLTPKWNSCPLLLGIPTVLWLISIWFNQHWSTKHIWCWVPVSDRSIVNILVLHEVIRSLIGSSVILRMVKLSEMNSNLTVTIVALMLAAMSLPRSLNKHETHVNAVLLITFILWNYFIPNYLIQFLFICLNL